MSNKTVDDLVGALFPGEKLPPPTGVTAAQSWQQKQQQQNHGWDDSDQESPLSKNNNNNHTTTATTTNTSNSTNTQNNLSSFAPKPTTTTSTYSTSNNIAASTTAFIPKASATWPTLPKNLLRACDEATVTLTSNNIHQRDIQTHHHVLFPSPTTTNEQILEERDGSISGGLGGDVQYCSYIRCKKCGHPVVRLQNAYVKSPANSNNNSSSCAPAAAAGAVESISKKKKETGGHGFDDSSDDDDDVSKTTTTKTPIASASGGLLDEMYMVCRNHFPDFLALERTGRMKRMNDCAIYWCQCTMASVCSQKNAMVKFSTIQSGNENGKLLELPMAYVQTQMNGDAPYSTTEICWECVGHHKPFQ